MDKGFIIAITIAIFVLISIIRSIFNSQKELNKEIKGIASKYSDKFSELSDEIEENNGIEKIRLQLLQSGLFGSFELGHVIGDSSQALRVFKTIINGYYGRIAELFQDSDLSQKIADELKDKELYTKINMRLCGVVAGIILSKAAEEFCGDISKENFEKLLVKESQAYKKNIEEVLLAMRITIKYLTCEKVTDSIEKQVNKLSTLLISHNFEEINTYLTHWLCESINEAYNVVDVSGCKKTIEKNHLIG